MTTTFRLPAAEFAGLAAGRGGESAVRRLRRVQLSKHLLLIRSVVGTRPRSDVSLRRTVEVISAAQRRARDTVNQILSQSWIGAWAAACLRRSPPACDAPEFGYLSAAAAVAALRTGLAAELELVVSGGRVMLPTVGLAFVDVPDGSIARVVVRADAAVIHHEGGRVTVSATMPEDGEAWLAMRRLDLDCDGRRLSLYLDDVDPYRDCYGAALAPRMSAEEVSVWRTLFQEAWTLLVRYLPDRAAELSSGLHAVVPLAEGDPGLSVTSRDAFGAFALNRSRSAAALTDTFVHEFQHSKLSGVLDLLPLYDKRNGPLYHAPWRPDPRPIGALLQGAYAFLGVTDVWRALSDALADAGANDPRSLYAEQREQLGYVIPELAGSDRLTPAGHEFVAGMRTALEAMPVDSVPAVERTRARRSVLASRVAWRLRHRHPDTRQVSALADAFLAAAGAPAPTPDAAVLDAAAWSQRLATHETGPLFDSPELVVAVYQEVYARAGTPPEPVRLIRWLTGSLAG